MSNELQPAVETVEAELLGPGAGPRRRPEEPFVRPAPEKPGLLTRLKMLIAAGLALLGVGLVFAGALLTSTVIGAVIGIPLLLAGGLVFFLLFKLLSLGAKPAVFFRRF